MIASPAVSRTGNRLRLLAVAGGAFALCAVYAWRGYFSSDFWEHAAVVRELSVRPLGPKHPLLAVDAPHAYASPYLLALGLVARALGAPAIAVLAAAGLVNLVLLILALRRFLVRLLGSEAPIPYAVLFIVFLWGKDPWMWSGFFHIGMLGYTVAYPSTVAAAAMFLCLALVLDSLDQPGALAFLGIALLVGFCVITHPPTALILVAALGALFVARVRDRLGTTGGFLAGAAVSGIAAALAWPYFPVLQLFTAQPPEFHRWSGVFYQGVPAQVWPALIALPVLAWRLRADRRDPLVLLVAILGVVYAVGGITGRDGLGRAIGYMVVFVQIAAAAALADWERRLASWRGSLVPAGSVALSLVLFAYNRPPLPRILKHERPVWPEAAKILAPVRPGDVVLADSWTSYLVPALSGGRVVAWRHPVYWVPDHADRRTAQDRFFAPAADEYRRAVIARYGVRWLLLNRQQVSLSSAEEARLLDLGCIAAQGESLVLLDLRAECSRPRGPGMPGTPAGSQRRSEERAGAPSGADDASGRRARLPLDADWRFLLGDAPGASEPGFEATAWRGDLPHDWSIEQPRPIRRRPSCCTRQGRCGPPA